MAASTRSTAVAPVSTSAVAQPAIPEKKRFWTFIRVTVAAVAGMVALILIVFVIGLILALTDAQGWEPRLEIFKDAALVILSVQCVFIIVAIGVLVIQVARFINLLRSEVTPMTEDVKQSVNNIRMTTSFVGRQVVHPFIWVQSFGFGTLALLRELFAWRRLFRSNRRDND